jgi:hypothetical protein
MSSKQKKWESVDKTSIPIQTLVDRYLAACHLAGMSLKTIRGYHEKLVFSKFETGRFPAPGELVGKRKQ